MTRHNWHKPSGVREPAPSRAPNGSGPANLCSVHRDGRSESRPATEPTLGDIQKVVDRNTALAVK